MESGRAQFVLSFIRLYLFKFAKMVEKIQDLVLPNTVVTRLIKEALPDGINIGKEARAAISRAAAIFSEYQQLHYHYFG